MSTEFKTIFFNKKDSFFSQKLDTDLLQQQLNKLGQSGWQVASCSQFQTGLVIILQRNR